MFDRMNGQDTGRLTYDSLTEGQDLIVFGGGSLAGRSGKTGL
jgi:hypothetical protein